MTLSRRTTSEVTQRNPCTAGSGEGDEPDDCRCGDERGLGHLAPWLQECGERHDRDDDRGRAVDDLAGDDDRCAGDRAGRGGGGAFDEALEARVVLMPA